MNDFKPNNYIYLYNKNKNFNNLLMIIPHLIYFM